MVEADRRVASASTDTQETTLWSAVRRHWPIVLTCTVLSAILGLVIASSQDAAYEATAGVIIEDPRAQDPYAISPTGGLTNQASERYLADQVEILRSIVTATAAAESLNWEITPSELLRSTTVEGRLVSNLVEVTSLQATPERAREAADAVVAAYIQIRQEDARAVAAAAVEDIGSLIESTDVRLIAIRDEIDAVAGTASEQRAALLAQLTEAEAELIQARIDRDQAPPGSEARIALNARIEELVRDFVAWETILRIENPDAELAILLAQRDALIEERSALAARRDQLLVSSAADDGGVVLVSPAELPEEPAGIPSALIAVAITALGFSLGVAIAYARSLRGEDVGDQVDLVIDVGRPR
jgi:uncharacterized protein involved in exopolysaccharide biosynthesis